MTTGTGRASDTTPKHKADLTAGPGRAHAFSTLFDLSENVFLRRETGAALGECLLPAARKTVSLYARSASPRRDDVISSENGCAVFRFI